MAGAAAGAAGAALNATPYGAALNAVGQIAGALGDSGASSSSLEANGNVYGGINFGDAALNHKALPSFLANRLTGRPQTVTPTEKIISQFDPLTAVYLGGALLVTFLLLKRMA